MDVLYDKAATGSFGIGRSGMKHDPVGITKWNILIALNALTQNICFFIMNKVIKVNMAIPVKHVPFYTD